MPICGCSIILPSHLNGSCLLLLGVNKGAGLFRGACSECPSFAPALTCNSSSRKVACYFLRAAFRCLSPPHARALSTLSIFRAASSSSASPPPARLASVPRVVVCTVVALVAAAALAAAVLHHLPSFIAHLAHAVTKRAGNHTLPSIINLRHSSLLSSLELFCLLRLTAIYPSIPLSKYAVMLSFAPGCPNIT